MSTPHLLDLPTEILNQILTPLPTSSLLRFSETSRHARVLANANLHTFSLGIAPLAPAFFKYLDPAITTSTANPYDIWLRIPQARSYEYLTLHNFQSALVTSILKRHGTMLQHLNISVWALTLPMAKAITSLRALRTFSLRIESGVRYVRGIPRSRIAIEREEQGKAWEVLTESAVEWSGRLTVVRLENCDTLNLYDCQEQRPGEFERLNEELWHIKDFTAPRPGGYGENMIIEVDPDYIF
ncbi:hypothetical protein J4E81_002160 [Alternaria sp. BMP 2799]|nr:hypothetical protein J4E81_002160 [Alternaria sp. BMP 2799]